MLTENDKFELESDTSKTTAGAAQFQLKQGNRVLITYHQRNCHKHYRVLELELTG